MRRALAAAAVAALALTGCSGSDEPSNGSQETPRAKATAGESTSPSQGHADDSGNVVEIEIEGDRVEPRGERVEVAAGEPLTLKVESNRAAELHVHSSPEQELEVEPGESTLTVTVKTPGIVDVEEHETGVVVLQLEVR
jgi:uncharacterized protein YcfL